MLPAPTEECIRSRVPDDRCYNNVTYYGEEVGSCDVSSEVHLLVQISYILTDAISYKPFLANRFPRPDCVKLW